MPTGNAVLGRQRRATRLATGAVVLLLGAGLAGCSTGDSEAGFGLPTQPVRPPFPGEREPVRGTLRVESNGCFTLEVGVDDRRWIVWPEGAVQAGDRVRLSSSTDVGEGQVLTGTGALIAAQDLPDWDQPDSYFASFGTFCGAPERGVVLLDDVALG